MKSLKETKLRLLQMHYEAGVGHIGGNLSCIDILYTMYASVLKPEDVFVISKGHAAGAVYAVMWANGLCEDSDLKTFHKDGTTFPGHLKGTGSLGHGLGVAAGVSLHKKLWNKSGRVYCLTSDGEWDEGSNWEALSFICEHDLEVKIIVDANRLQGFKEASQCVFDRIHEYTCYVSVTEGHNEKELAHRLSADYPTDVVWAMTNKGNGVSFLQDKLGSHYDPLTKEQYEQACREIESA
jgi:transketolase